MLAERLRYLPGLPPNAAWTLTEALLALNYHQVNALVEPSRRDRKGRRPADIANAQILLLQWRAFRIACGEREADVEARIAGAIDRSRESLDDWRRSLLGDARTQKSLQGALDDGARLGRAVAAEELIPHTRDWAMAVYWQDSDYLGRLAELLRSCR